MQLSHPLTILVDPSGEARPACEEGFVRDLDRRLAESGSRSATRSRAAMKSSATGRGSGHISENVARRRVAMPSSPSTTRRHSNSRARAPARPGRAGVDLLRAPADEPAIPPIAISASGPMDRRAGSYNSARVNWSNGSEPAARPPPRRGRPRRPRRRHRRAAGSDYGITELAGDIDRAHRRRRRCAGQTGGPAKVGRTRRPGSSPRRARRGGRRRRRRPRRGTPRRRSSASCPALLELVDDHDERPHSARTGGHGRQVRALPRRLETSHRACRSAATGSSPGTIATTVARPPAAAARDRPRTSELLPGPGCADDGDETCGRRAPPVVAHDLAPEEDGGVGLVERTQPHVRVDPGGGRLRELAAPRRRAPSRRPPFVRRAPVTARRPAADRRPPAEHQLGD